jgi:hypothetical protein
MSGEIAGPGFLLKVSPAGAGTYVTVARVRDIKGPEQTVTTEDVTNQDSPNNYREWIPTLIDGGTVTFAASFIPTDSTQAGILTDLQARTLMDFEVEIGTTGLALFWSGFVVKFGTSYPVANVALVDVDIKVTGPVVGPTTAI